MKRILISSIQSRGVIIVEYIAPSYHIISYHPAGHNISVLYQLVAVSTFCLALQVEMEMDGSSRLEKKPSVVEWSGASG